MSEKLVLPDLSSSDELFLHELSEQFELLANAHLASEKEYIPFEFADEIDQQVADGALDLSSPEAHIDEETKTALFVNLLTEEGLPEYTSTIQRRVPADHPLRHWSHLWTADEGRHGPTIAVILHKHGFNMRVLERARMAMMRQPETPQPPSVIESLIYPGIQEPATEISHRNTMRRLPKALTVGRRALGYVIRDEVRHGAFYASASEAAMEVDPSITIIGVARQVRDFSMPGKSIPGFKDHAKIIETADIFGLRQLRQIYEDFIVTRLNIYRAERLSPKAEEARDFIAKRLQLMDKMIERRMVASAEQAVIA